MRKAKRAFTVIFTAVALLVVGLIAFSMSIRFKGWVYRDGHLKIFSNRGMCNWMEQTDIPSDTIVSLEFGDQVAVVPKQSFMNYKELRYINFGKGVHTIEEEAFRYCEKAKKIVWSPNLKVIEHIAFEGVAIEQLLLPNGVQSVGALAFGGCKELIEVVLPDSLTHLDCNFQDCIKLENVVLSNGLERLEDYMFGGCTNLTEVSVPESVISIGIDPFMESGIQRIVFHGEVDNIEAFRFADCPQLKQMIFLKGQPKYVDKVIDSDKVGIVPSENSNAIVYYLNKHVDSWSPNGETEWKGLKIVGVESLEDIPNYGN